MRPILEFILAARYSPACVRACVRAQVLRLPMSFFDSQPAGRLLNRFSRDTEAADILLRENLAYWIYEVCASRAGHPYDAAFMSGVE